ncbi:18807_t:CDS:2 [Funneliformis geosporum]|uniref:18807_t:CDS:1 n=1 Tax=Funneliformis geosporum TaxID=1117311 RepID=A0A9W4SKH5_9GLOM|nr:18807_t:CDS:2 [Funneliformis geosporum]
MGSALTCLKPSQSPPIPSVVFERYFSFNKTTIANLPPEFYLKCLNKKSKQYLCHNGVILPTNIIEDISSPIFDYPSFLRELKFSDIYNGISDWFSNVIGNLTDEQQTTFLKILITEQLFKLFMNQCSTFDLLSLSDIPYETAMPLLPLLTGPVNCFSRLKSFQCVSKHNNKSEIFRAISQVSEFIETLEVGGVDHDMEVKALGVLIRAQKKLKTFKYTWDYQTKYQIVLSDTLCALQSQAKSLTMIQFEYCNFHHCNTMKALTAFENLKNLQFIHCIYIGDKMNTFINAKFSNLKYLGFYNNCIESPRYWVCPDDVAALVNNCHDNLEQIILPRTGNCTISSHKLVKSLRLCRNIKDLKVQMGEGDIDEFLEFLQINEKLENLTLICYGDLNIEHFLTKTNQSWPSTLSSLNLRGQWIISPEYLKILLKECKSIKRLDLHSSHITDDHVGIVIEYVKEMRVAKKAILHSCLISGERMSEKGRKKAREFANLSELYL